MDRLHPPLKWIAALAAVSHALLLAQTPASDRVKPGAPDPVVQTKFTADPAPLVHDGVVYLYTGHDEDDAHRFTMRDWQCYSSTDMVNWTDHGAIASLKTFPWAKQDNGAWAAQVIERNGKFYLYATVFAPDNTIAVAASDKPTGPFVDALGGPLVKGKGFIAPSIFIDDDGTPWLMWGNGDFYLAKLNRNMIELDGPVQKVPHENVAEGPWLFKRNGIYYNVYAADVPGTKPEQIAYATADKVTGPWSYRGLVTGPAKVGFTIHPAVFEFKGQWYFFYHDGSTSLNGLPGGDFRRSVCLEYLYFNPDGSIRPITQTPEGVSVPPRR